jgi:hypothetical protein
MPSRRSGRSEAWRRRVSAGERGTDQSQDAVEEAVVLDEIARHRCIGHGSGEQLFEKAMPHGLRPTRLARSAQVSVKRSGMVLVPAEIR